jgi:hypothetical protein
MLSDDLAQPTSRRRGWRRLCESLEKLSDDRLGEPSPCLGTRQTPSASGLGGDRPAARARQAARAWLRNAWWARGCWPEGPG